MSALRSPLPAIGISLALHLGAWWAIPRGGAAVLGVPGESVPPLVWVEVGEVLAMPGTGTDLFAGPGVAGGGAWPGPTDGVPPVGGGGVVAGEGGGPEPMDLPVAEGRFGGVPVPTEPGDGEPATAARERALRALALEGLRSTGAGGDGPPGQGVRGIPGASGEFFGVGHRMGTVTDPEILLWQLEVRQRLMAEFHPLPSLARTRPDLVVQVRIALDPASGEVRDREVIGSSGSAAFDAAALRAVDAVPVLPPAPGAWHEALSDGVTLRFTHPR